MSSELALNVSNLSKCYRIFPSAMERFKQAVGFGRSQRYKEFWALKKISFQVEKGQTIGIIGRNGAGKSTLLKLICGVLNPTSGSVEVAGKVAALLELGSGFNPDFTGRENVMMSAALYGLSKHEIYEVIDRVIDFSEIGEFVDQPVKTYSSGMFVRLAFSVIAHVKADILIVDEALSVGDVKFQQKCNRFLEDFKKNGGSILFVSHDITMVRSICDKVIYLRRNHDGDYCDFLSGDPADITKNYIEDLYTEKSSLIAFQKTDNTDTSNLKPNFPSMPRKTFSYSENNLPMVTCSSFSSSKDRFGNGEGLILDAQFIDKEGLPLHHFNVGDSVCLKVILKAEKNIDRATLALIIKDRTGNYLFSDGTAGNFEIDLPLRAKELAEVKFYFTFPYLIGGDYTLDLSFADGDILDHQQLDWINDCLIISVGMGRNVVGQVGFSNYQVNWQIFSAEDRA